VARTLHQGLVQANALDSCSNELSPAALLLLELKSLRGTARGQATAVYQTRDPTRGPSLFALLHHQIDVPVEEEVFNLKMFPSVNLCEQAWSVIFNLWFFPFLELA